MKLNVFFKDELKKVPVKELLGKTLYLDNQKNSCHLLYGENLRTILKVYVSKSSTDEKVVLKYEETILIPYEEDLFESEITRRNKVVLNSQDVEHLYFATGKSYFNPNAYASFHNVISVIVKMNFINTGFTGLYEYFSYNIFLKPGDKVKPVGRDDFGEVVRIVECYNSYTDKVAMKYGTSREVIKMDEDFYNLKLSFFFNDKPEFKEKLVDEKFKLLQSSDNCTFIDQSRGFCFSLIHFTLESFKDIYLRLCSAFEEKSREYYDIKRHYQIYEKNDICEISFQHFLHYALCKYYKIAKNITHQLGEIYVYEDNAQA